MKERPCQIVVYQHGPRPDAWPFKPDKTWKRNSRSETWFIDEPTLWRYFRSIQRGEEGISILGATSTRDRVVVRARQILEKIGWIERREGKIVAAEVEV